MGTKVGLKEIVEGFARLGEPPQVVASLTQLLTPIVNTFPRMILRSLVKSADKNMDGSMDWKEFEGFGDFELVFTRWPKMWRLLQDNLFAGMNTCEGERCFPAPWTTEDLRRCLKALISHISRAYTILSIRLSHIKIFAD